ncbi:MAG: hypothetical protein ACRCSN_20170, partial [Dermatophilaceae bacterium]
MTATARTAPTSAPAATRVGRRGGGHGGAQDAVRGFRPDIEALRALAVVLVVANHADVPGLPG